MTADGTTPSTAALSRSVEWSNASRVPLVWADAAGDPLDGLMQHEVESGPAAGDVLGTAADEVLVDASRAGNREAFDVLVSRHQRRVYQVCYRLLGTHEDAADAAQDTFLRAYRALGGFGDRSSFGTWLYRVAVNVALSRAAQPSRRGEPIEHAQHVPAPGEAADEALDRAGRASAVRAAVARLPPKQRLTLVLRVYQGLSHEEIARVLGRSVGTVKANLFFAMRNLKAMLRAGGER